MLLFPATVTDIVLPRLLYYQSVHYLMTPDTIEGLVIKVDSPQILNKFSDNCKVCILDYALSVRPILLRQRPFYYMYGLYTLYIPFKFLTD